ncbi:MAG: YlzJ-like family protein [Halanaerobiaceae bacterium]
MINYSIYERDFVFQNWEKFEPEYEIIDILPDLKIQVERINSKQVKLIQIISNNPNYYLNKNLTPGSILNNY